VYNEIIIKTQLIFDVMSKTINSYLLNIEKIKNTMMLKFAMLENIYVDF